MTNNKKFIIEDNALIQEWNWTKNNELGLAPKTLTCGSGKKAWWKCSKDHEWLAIIKSRYKGNGCPYCAGRKVLKGYNDLETLNPKLASEWHPNKNGELAPKDVTVGSKKKIWWKCPKGHEWIASITNRYKGSGCPYCVSKKVLKGYNDLETLNPKLASEWHPTKNGELTPKDVTVGSGKKVWWKCSKGHEWFATIHHRSNGSGCPVCDSERKTSTPEYAIVYYLEKNCIKTIHRYNEKGYELDIYIPSKKIAIEYDGSLWHKNRLKKDLEKNLKCQQDGIKLYRIREGLPTLNDSSIDYIVQENQKNLPEVIKKVLSEIIEKSVDVDLKRDAIEIENLREYVEKTNSLLFTNPELAKEWNYKRNGSFKPENITTGSKKTVWWMCNKGHEWTASIASRNKGSGCPYCSSQKVLSGYNDLATLNPNLANEWHTTKNRNLTPKDVIVGSNKKVWWKCSKGHEWLALISHRNSGRGCPYCANKKVLQGYNDLTTINPKLAKEWNYDKNDNLLPEDFTVGSDKIVWWKCSKGHEWQNQIYSRNKGIGCPYCSGRYVIKGKNDLATINPKLASEWNYNKNKNLKPEDFSANSGVKVWWKCAKGHEWQVRITDRNNGNGCPYCSGRYVIKGKNDLATINPKLASEWNYDKNGNLKPEDFSASSHNKTWWKCNNCKHEWQAVIRERVKGRKKCPNCKNSQDQ